MPGLTDRKRTERARRPCAMRPVCWLVRQAGRGVPMLPFGDILEDVNNRGPLRPFAVGRAKFELIRRTAAASLT